MSALSRVGLNQKAHRKKRLFMHENQQVHPDVTKPPILNIPPVIILIVGVCLGAFFVPEYLFSQALYEKYMAYCAFIPQFFRHVTMQVWYTPISYSFMHGSIMHVVVNMLWLVIFGSPLANRIGNIRFLIFWCVCAIAAAFAHGYLYSASYTPLVGASGAISGMMGAAARYGFRRVETLGRDSKPEFAGPILSIPRSLASKSVLVFIGTWLLINVFTGLGSVSGADGEPGIAWEAHIGGLAAGFFLAGLFDRRRQYEY